jgi:hypothetical protein
MRCAYCALLAGSFLYGSCASDSGRRRRRSRRPIESRSAPCESGKNAASTRTRPPVPTSWSLPATPPPSLPCCATRLDVAQRINALLRARRRDAGSHAGEPRCPQFLAQRMQLTCFASLPSTCPHPTQDTSFIICHMAPAAKACAAAASMTPPAVTLALSRLTLTRAALTQPGPRGCAPSSACLCGSSSGRISRWGNGCGRRRGRSRSTACRCR